jgi:hypothetical protein
MTSLRKGSIPWLLSLLVVAVAGLSWFALAQDSVTRSVKGLVTDQAERPLPEAVVQLKNTRTLQVKSFIADEKGQYYFHGLDPNVDYELRAQYEGVSSRPHKVSSFDAKREVIYNFTLEIPRHSDDRSLLEKGADATVSGAKTAGTAIAQGTTAAAKATAGAATTAATATADAVVAGAQAAAEGAKTVGEATIDGTTAAGRGVGRFFGGDRPEPEGVSERVVRAQGKLKEKGLYDGAADGVAGPKTAQALRQYQEENGLPVDGQLNDQTAKHLGIQ